MFTFCLLRQTCFQKTFLLYPFFTMRPLFNFTKLALLILVIFNVHLASSKKWSSNTMNLVCTWLESVEQAFHVGDYLLLPATVTARGKVSQLSKFYVYNWRNGQLKGQAVEQNQLFDFGKSTDIPNGELLFASTYDLCALQSGGRKSKVKRQLEYENDFDLTRSDFAKYGERMEMEQKTKPAMVVDKLEEKLSDIQSEINQLREKAFIEKEHSEIKQQLALMNRDLRALIRSIVANQPTTTMATTSTVPEEQEQMNEPNSAITLIPTTTTMNADIELYKQMRELFLNLSKLVIDVNAKVEELKAKTIATITKTSKPTTTSQRLSTAASTTAATTPAAIELPLIEEPESHCPLVVIATFGHSHQTQESAFCRDNNHNGKWLKSVIFQYEPKKSGLPRMTPFGSMGRRWLLFRGTIQSNNGRFVKVRPDLSCLVQKNTKSNSLRGGFNIANRMFLQTKPQMLKEYGNLYHQDEISISEMLNCYDNSSVFSNPIRVIDAPPLANKDDEQKINDNRKFSYLNKKLDLLEIKTNKNWDNGESMKLLKRLQKHHKKTQGNIKKAMPTKWTANNITTLEVTKTTTVTAASSLFESLTINKSKISMQDYEESLKLNQLLKDRSITEQNNKQHQGNKESKQKEKSSKKSYLFIGLGIVVLVGIAIAGFIYFTLIKTTTVLNANDNMSGDNEGPNYQRKDKRKKNGNKDKENKKKPFKKDDSDDGSNEGKKTNKKPTTKERGHERNKRDVQMERHKSKGDKKMKNNESNGNGPTGVEENNIDEPAKKEQLSNAPAVPINANPVQQNPEMVNDTNSTPNNEVDLHEVVVIDPENVLQFCGDDKQMANRIEMMIGESKVIAQLTKPTMGADLANVDSCAPTVMNITINKKSQHGNGDSKDLSVQEHSHVGEEQSQAKVSRSKKPKSTVVNAKAANDDHFYKIGHKLPIKSPSISSPKSEKQKSSPKLAEENMRLIKVLHRMRKGLKKKKGKRDK